MSELDEKSRLDNLLGRIFYKLERDMLSFIADYDKTSVVIGSLGHDMLTAIDQYLGLASEVESYPYAEECAYRMLKTLAEYIKKLNELEITITKEENPYVLNEATLLTVALILRQQNILESIKTRVVRKNNPSYVQDTTVLSS